MPSWPNSRRLAALLGALAVLALAAAGCGGSSDAEAPASPAATPTPASLPARLEAASYPLDLAEGTRLGRADAPVVIEMFEDFGCPHCLEFTAEIEPRLISDYVATGKVALVYRFFPLRQSTAAAALGAACAAAQDGFWPYHSHLFAAQARANSGEGPPIAIAYQLEGLREIAGRTGLDLAAFDACIQSEAPIAVVEADLRAANDLGLGGTPSFVIGGKVYENPGSWGAWQKLLSGLVR